MTKRSLVIVVCCLAVLLASPLSGIARPRGPRTSSGQLTCTPDTTTSPVVSTSPLTLCVSGFAPGNFVSILVPWVGSPDFHSTYSHSEYVGESGGFCYSAPPSWATMLLTPGTYTVQTLVSRDGAQSLRQGPGAALTIVVR